MRGVFKTHVKNGVTDHKILEDALLRYEVWRSKVETANVTISWQRHGRLIEDFRIQTGWANGT